MHPLDLSPQANSSHSTLLFSSDRSLRPTRNVLDQNHRDASHRTNKLGHKREQDQGKRGRPRADILTTLMVEGSSSRSKIRCVKCGRAFPREKSLQAHVRTHTGEKPYACDYPGCSKAFCQSGQLKTHQRLHTGEKPFACVADGCESRFTHANRHCSSHPQAGLKRLEISLNQVTRLCDGQSNPEVKRWIEKYMRQSKERQTSKPLSKKSSIQELMPSKQTSVCSNPMKTRGTSTYKMRKVVSPPIKFCPVQEEKVTPLDLTQNRRSPSLPRLSPIPLLTKTVHVRGPPPALIPIMSQLPSPVPLVLPMQSSSHVTSSSNTQSSPLSSYLPLSMHSASQSSSTLSSLSSTSLSSPACSSNASLQTLNRPHSTLLPPSEGKDEFYPYVFSSQMVLQGHSNVNGSYYSPFFPIPVNYSYKSTVSSATDQSNPRGKEKEKDRYISALALIELSKG